MTAVLVPPPWLSCHSLIESTFRILAKYAIDLDISPQIVSGELATFYTPLLREFNTVHNVSFLWAVVLHAASQTQPDSTAHSRITDVLLALHAQPPPPTTEALAKFEAINRHAFTFWSALPLIHLVWTDYEYAAPLHPRKIDRPGSDRRGSFRTPSDIFPWSDVPLDSAQWASMNAVLAKLHARTEIQKLDLRGLFAMIDALEWERDAAALDDLVPAAAVWVIFAGKALKSNIIPYAQHPYDGGTSRLPWSVGPLWKGIKIFSNERWQFWRERFGVVRAVEGVSNLTREWADKACVAMGEIGGEIV